MYFCQYSSERANDGTEAERQTGKNKRLQDLGLSVTRNTEEKERESKELGSCTVWYWRPELRGNPVKVTSDWAMTELLTSSHVILSRTQIG